MVRISCKTSLATIHMWHTVQTLSDGLAPGNRFLCPKGRCRRSWVHDKRDSHSLSLGTGEPGTRGLPRALAGSSDYRVISDQGTEWGNWGDCGQRLSGDNRQTLTQRQESLLNQGRSGSGQSVTVNEISGSEKYRYNQNSWLAKLLGIFNLSRRHIVKV